LEVPRSNPKNHARCLIPKVQSLDPLNNSSHLGLILIEYAFEMG